VTTTDAVAGIPTPVLFHCVLRHERREGVGHAFSAGYWAWLVDIDELPSLPAPVGWFGDILARDHFGDPHGTLRSNVDTLLTVSGLPTGGRVLLLAQARGLGHVFDPLSLFWCHDREDRLACVIAEVRNTFGERHCYLLRPDVTGRSEVAKEFYVSPFFPVDGRYLIRTVVTADRLAVTFVLRRPERVTGVEHTAFVAALRGRAVPTGRFGLLHTALRHPFNTLATTAAIHYQALRLRRTGLPLRRRRHHEPQPGVGRPERRQR
jgi:uncharacterized protein